MIDQPTSVRAGEEINSVKLGEYLSLVMQQPFQDVLIEQFPGGYSNLTYLLKVGTAEYILRKPPIGANIKSAHERCEGLNQEDKLGVWSLLNAKTKLALKKYLEA